MPLTDDQLFIRKKLFKFMGEEFSVFDGAGNLVAFASQRFKLREDIRLFADREQTHELLRLHTQSIMDLSPRFEVVDSPTGQVVGALKRAGLKSSLISDEWQLFDGAGAEIGSLKEDSLALALVRRFVSNLVPQTFHLRLGDRVVGEFRQAFNPFMVKVTVDFSSDTERSLDRRLGVAAAVIACAVEGRQG